MTLPRKILFFAFSLLFAAPALAADEVDKAAIEDLRALVAAECKAHPECPLDDLFSRLQEPIVANMTTFEVQANKYYVKKADGSDDDGSDSASDAQSGGITPDEWQALQASGIKDVEGYGAGYKSYALVDLDGDGQRDLVINNDEMGEWDGVINTFAFHREGGKFEGLASFRGDYYDEGYLYLNTEDGRNIAAHWVRLRGRIYAIWRIMHYGYDHIYLLRPFITNHEVPMLTVRYRYQLSVKTVDEWHRKDTTNDKKRTAAGDEKRIKAMNAALQSMSDKTRDANISKTPLCSIPASVKNDDRKWYYTFYTVSDPDPDIFPAGEDLGGVVGDMPIRVGSKCYIGRFYSKGIYGSRGLADTSISMYAFDRDDGWEGAVSGTRKMISVEISTRKCDRKGCY